MSLVIVDKQAGYQIAKSTQFPKGQPPRVEYLVINEALRNEKGLALAIVGNPYITLSEARASIGRVLPNNTEKTLPKSAYAAFSGPAHMRGGSKR